MFYFENLPWRQTLSLQRQHNTVPIYSAAQKLEPGDDSRQGGNAHTDGHMGLQSQAMMPDWVGTPHTDSHMGLQSQVMIPDGVGMPV